MFDWLAPRPRRRRRAIDRRAGPRQGPYVGRLPRARNANGQWRRKRVDAGRPRRRGLFSW